MKFYLQVELSLKVWFKVSKIRIKHWMALKKYYATAVLINDKIILINNV